MRKGQKSTAIKPLSRDEIKISKDQSWLDGYNHGARDCAGDYEVGLRKVSWCKCKPPNYPN